METATGSLTERRREIAASRDMVSPFEVEVTSEFGRLRAVLVHRPGEELRRLRPGNTDELLFDDIVWMERAQAEHEVFVRTLRAHGVQVLLLEDLLADVVLEEGPRHALIGDTLRLLFLSERLGTELRSWLHDLQPPELLRVLIAGLTWQEFSSQTGAQALAAAVSPDEFLIAPLPNHLFVRDSSACLFDRIVVPPMAMPNRRREGINLASVYRHHPLFRSGSRLMNMWSAEDAGALASFEGGDLLILNEHALLVAVGHRTHAAAIERLAERLFESERVAEIVITVLPAERATVHLDAALTMVDRNTFLGHEQRLRDMQTVRLLPGRRGPRVKSAPDLLTALRITLRDRPLLIPLTRDGAAAEREQWSAASNVLALAPRVVVAYERNVATNQELDRWGIEVIELPGSELSRGRGGPRCMSCPLRREPAA
jgi:arginine deiminase